MRLPTSTKPIPRVYPEVPEWAFSWLYAVRVIQKVIYVVLRNEKSKRSLRNYLEQGCTTWGRTAECGLQ